MNNELEMLILEINDLKEDENKSDKIIKEMKK